MLVVGLALLMTLGLFVATANRMTMLLTMMPVVVSIVAFADSVHILHKYFIESQSTDDRAHAICKAMGLMNGACLMTSVTTSLGFFALYVASSIAAVRLFAFWTAIGVLIAFMLIIIVLPIVLLLLPSPSERILEGYRRRNATRLIGSLLRFSRRPQIATPMLPSC